MGKPNAYPPESCYPSFDNWPAYRAAFDLFAPLNPEDKTWHNDGAPSFRIDGAYEIYIPWVNPGEDEINQFSVLIPDDVQDGQPWATGGASFDFDTAAEASAFVRGRGDIVLHLVTMETRHFTWRACDLDTSSAVRRLVELWNAQPAADKALGNRAALEAEFGIEVEELRPGWTQVR